MDAREELDQANGCINVAVTLLRPNVDLMRRFREERRSLESVGPVLAPALFLDREKRAVGDMLAPVYEAAEKLVAEFDKAERAFTEGLRA